MAISNKRISKIGFESYKWFLVRSLIYNSWEGSVINSLYLLESSEYRLIKNIHKINVSIIYMKTRVV